jgi:phospholipase/lecithinase/hemolysin
MHDSNIPRRLARFASAIALALLSCSALAQPKTIDRLVFFGGSLTDTGNSFIWLSSPAGQGCGVPLSVPPYDMLDPFIVPDGPYARGGHHFSNGANWAEGVARALALAGNARPAFSGPGTQASNYAVGGARAVAGYPCRYNLPAQVAAYRADFAQTSERTWITMEIGGNDMRDGLVAVLVSQDPAAAGPYISRALESIGESVGVLYAHGARKFLLLNVPNIGLAPAVRPFGPVAVSVGDSVSKAFNDNLVLLTQGLKALLPGSDIRILDLYTTLNEVVASPGSYGFANWTDACVTPNQPPFACKQPDSYLFWDGTHPTKAMHAIIAQQALAKIAAP